MGKEHNQFLIVGCFVCMHVCVPHACLFDFLELELLMIVNTIWVMRIQPMSYANSAMSHLPSKRSICNAVLDVFLSCSVNE